MIHDPSDEEYEDNNIDDEYEDLNNISSSLQYAIRAANNINNSIGPVLSTIRDYTEPLRSSLRSMAQTATIAQETLSSFRNPMQEAMSTIRKATQPFTESAKRISRLTDSMKSSMGAISSFGKIASEAYNCLPDNSGFIGSAVAACESMGKAGRSAVAMCQNIKHTAGAYGFANEIKDSMSSLYGAKEAFDTLRNVAALRNNLLESIKIPDYLSQIRISNNINEHIKDISATFSTIKQLNVTFASTARLWYSRYDDVRDILSNVAEATRIVQDAVIPELYGSYRLLSSRFNRALLEMHDRMHDSLHDIIGWICYSIVRRPCAHYSPPELATTIHVPREDIQFKVIDQKFLCFVPKIRHITLHHRQIQGGDSDGESEEHINYFVA